MSMRGFSPPSLVAIAMLLMLSAPMSPGDHARGQEPDTVAPTLVSVETDTTGNYIILTFSEDIVASPLVYLAGDLFNSMPSDFLRAIMNVTIDGQRELLTEAEISGTELTFRAQSPAITSAQQVLISHDNIFAKNYPGIITDRAGNALASFAARVVQNRSTVPAGEAPRASPVLSTDAITVAEGETTTYSVALPTQPTGEVVVDVATIPLIIVATPSTLTFDEDNWDEPQTVTITTAHDSNAFDLWAIVGHTYRGLSIGRSSAFARVVIDDDETPLSVTGTEAIVHAENATGPLATYSVSGAASIRWGVYGPDKEAFTITSGGVLSLKSAPDFEQPADIDGDNVYVVAVLAADGSSTGFVFVAVAITDVPEPPTYIGPSTTREVPENSAAGTDVGDPVEAIDDAADTLEYTLAGDDAASFRIVSTSGQIQTLAGVTYDYETKSSYSVTVTAADGNDPPQTATTAVTILVTDVNDAPLFPDATAAREVAENPNAGTNVGPAVTASDQDDRTLSYSLSGADAASFQIVEGTGQIQTRLGVTYNHEGRSSYPVTVRVSDGKNAAGQADPAVDDTIAVTITITDVDERPELTGPVTATYRENQTGVVARYSAVDPEGAAISWSLSGADGRAFEIDNGALEFDMPPDFETRSIYRVRVEASDSSTTPRLTTTRDLTVTVTDENEPPVFTSTVPGIVSHDENRTGTVATFAANDPDRGDTISWSLDGSDADAFTITNGVLAFDPTKPAPDHETRDAYRVTVEASSGGDTVEQSIAVNITDLDEPGTLSLPRQPQVDVDYQATFTDDDDVTGASWTWERSPNRSTWSCISDADGDGACDSGDQTYTPDTNDLGNYLRATLGYNDGHGDKVLRAVSANRVQPREPDNTAPSFPNTTETRSVNENSTPGRPVGLAVQATDSDPGDTLSYSLSGSELFTIDPVRGQILVARGAVLDHETPGGDSHSVVVQASDPSGATATTTVTITVNDVNEAPVANDDPNESTPEDTPASIHVLDNDSDPDADDTGDTLMVSLQGRPANGRVTLNADNSFTYTPNDDFARTDSFTYRIRDAGGLRSNTAKVTVRVSAVNDAPAFPASSLERRVRPGAVAGTKVGAPVTANDVDDDPLRYSLSGGGAAFTIDEFSAQITVTGSAPLDTTSPYEVTVTADDLNGGTVDVDVTIRVTTAPLGPVIIFGGGGGGGGAGGPTPSEVDFEWAVEHDIEELDAGHDMPTGMWSDGVTLWLADNAGDAGDAVYAYDIETGERVEEREFELDEMNRAPRGVWSDRKTVWVSDSGRDRLFAHDLASGERLTDRDIALHEDNADARGIWSDTERMWVLDARAAALFAYRLTGGEPLGEYALDPANSEPHGVWSDGDAIWVSDHGEKGLLAYRLPAVETTGAPAEADLKRVTEEEFRKLSRASNNSPRGVWSDGDVMYVADQADDKIYSYNMPDAIDARLSSLTLEGIEITAFDPGHTDYMGVVTEAVSAAVVAAEARQRGASVVIDPPDADGTTDGHQVALGGLTEIVVTVTSADGNRTKVYRVRIDDPTPEPRPSCLRGDVAAGFSLLAYGGGTVEDLVACAESRGVDALYALHDGVYISYILGAPDLVNAGFTELYAQGVPSPTPLVAASSGPPSEDPGADIEAPQPWPTCLRGEVAEGFSLVLYEGGAVTDMVACAHSYSVAAVYALVDGEWVSYILGAPEFVNPPFAEVFAEGLPAVTPLVVKSEAPPAADRDDEGASDN